MHDTTTFSIFVEFSSALGKIGCNQQILLRMMQTNNHKLSDYDLVLDAKFGKEGTAERAMAEEAAYSFYSGQILHECFTA